MFKLKDFKFKTQIRVRTWEVDWQGVVHNSNYLRYFEIGRLEYRRNLGYNLKPDGTFGDGLKVFVVHNSIDYHSIAILDDILNIFTRVEWIKKSSFCFQQIITKTKKNTVICSGRGILVNVNPNNNLPEKLPDKFIKEIVDYDKKVEIIR